jgi:hypothetical protein
MWFGEVREPSYENYADGEREVPPVFESFEML